jgi:hypothetical protein
MLGATSEKLFGKKISKEQKKLLKNYYQKARKIVPLKYKEAPNKDKRVIEKEKRCNPIEGIDLSDLKYYRKYFCGEKKFPWFWVVGGIVVVGVLAILLLKKNKKKKYTLTVSPLGLGIEGSPGSGTYIYNEDEEISYSYSLLPGYSDLVVVLDGNEVPPAGTINMDRDHTLTVYAHANEVIFVLDPDSVTFTIGEGKKETFSIRLSAEPPNDVNVTVRVSSGSGVSVKSGGNLVFTSTDWDRYQTVELEAAEDDDTTNNEATIEISAPGIPQKNIAVIVEDDDTEEIDNPPTVRITHPSNGDTVYENVTITATASDDKRVIRVEFYIDGERTASLTSAPYQYKWNTITSFVGEHEIKVIAYDSAGQKAEHKITVVVER